MSCSRLQKRKKFRIQLSEEQAISARNYARLMRLFPAWQTLDEFRFGVGNGVEVSVAVLNRDKYSSVFELIEHKPASALPNSHCKLRVYHDAQLIDITEWNGESRFKPRYDYPNAAMLARDEKWQLSRFLGEWLDHCLKHGCSLSVFDLSYE